MTGLAASIGRNAAETHTKSAMPQDEFSRRLYIVGIAGDARMMSTQLCEFLLGFGAKSAEGNSKPQMVELENDARRVDGC